MKRARAAPHTAPASRSHPHARPSAAAAGSVVRSIFGGSAATAAAKPSVQSSIQLRTLRECTETQSGLVSLLCVVSSSEGERDIQRRDGSTVALSTLLVSDASARLVPLKVWGAAQCAAAGRWRPGDVLLCRGMEVTRFRLAASLSTKAQSVIAVMDTQMMGAERDEATAAAAAAAEPAEAAAKRRRVVGGSGGGGGGGGGSGIGDTGRREFTSAHSHLRWNDLRDLGSSTSNWAEICAAARALWSWAQRVDGHALLGRSNESPQQQQQQQSPFTSTAAVTRSSLLGPGAAAAGANAALQSAIVAPFVSLLSLEGGQLVSVSVRLRRFCLLPSSAAAARPNAFGAHAALASGASVDPPPRSQSLCCVLSQDDEGAELLVEAELRAPRWLTGDRLSFFRGALGRRVRLQAVRVQWSARADALALVDTEHTVISLEHTAGGAQRTGDEPGASAPAMRPALLLGLSFPSLSHEQSAQLLRHVRSAVVASSSSLSLAAADPLPADLFAQLFYSGCAQCAAALLPDSNGVLECASCLVGSRASQPPPESQPRLQWMYRDARLHLAPANAAAVGDSGGDGGLDGDDCSTPSPPPPLVVASHAALIDLLGHIDPVTLRSQTRTAAALHQQSQQKADGTQSSAIEPGSSAPEDPSPPSMSQLLRVQWCRLLLTLLHRDNATNEGPASPPPLIHFALEEPAMTMAHRGEGGAMATSAAAPPRHRPPAAAALPLLACIDMWRV